MKKKFFITALFTHSFLQAGEFGTLFMSATLFTLLITLIFTLTIYLKKLQKESLKNSALFDHSDVATLFINAKGHIVDLNQSAETLLGYSKKQLASQKWYEKLLPDENALQLRHQIHKTLKEDTRISFHSFLVSANAKVLEVNYTLSAIPKPIKGMI